MTISKVVKYFRFLCACKRFINLIFAPNCSRESRCNVFQFGYNYNFHISIQFKSFIYFFIYVLSHFHT
nr:MAG TPA: hypothetical protein [Caudoviricetes sp.]